jgi:hypothetical protein
VVPREARRKRAVRRSGRLKEGNHFVSEADCDRKPAAFTLLAFSLGQPTAGLVVPNFSLQEQTVGSGRGLCWL